MQRGARALTRGAVLAAAVLSAVPSFASASPVPADWPRVATEHFVVVHPPGYGSDGTLIGEFAEEAWVLYREVLGVEPPIAVVIYLYDRERYPREPSSAWAELDPPSLHLLAPSAQPADQREWQDRLWYRKNVAHEFGHVALHAVGPGSGRMALFLFQEGIPEYLSVYRLGLQVRAKYAAYEQGLRDRARAGRLAFLHFEDEYGLAAQFIRFIEETFGQGAAIRVWRSSAPSWSQAIRDELGVDMLELEERWLRWAGARR